jgi:hypothetical protein
VIYHEGKLHGQGVLGEDPYWNRMSRVTATPLTGKLLMLASQTPVQRSDVFEFKIIFPGKNRFQTQFTPTGNVE